MVDSLKKPASATFEELRPGVKAPVKDTILTPRFYTTDFEAMAKMDLSPNEDELQAILEEFRADYNRHHFVRTPEFDGSTEGLDPETKKVFVEFLEQSCTSEFSGFLLYKELSRKIKDRNPVLAECFALMSRDEARHAGFLNKSMSDFGMQLDLGFLTANKKYTFFKPEYIFYATYLSEKIGYWRYITIYRHLEKHPEKRLYPIFKFFENWCQDENRHGDFFDAVMQAVPSTVNGLKARLWCRFFLLAVFATMYIRDVQRTEFYEALGLDTREYDKHVIRETNLTAGRVFPVILDTENPVFYERLERCVENNQQLQKIAEGGAIAPIQLLQKLPYYVSNGVQFAALFLMKPFKSTEALPAVM